MASYQITHVRVSQETNATSEHITHVKLSGGTTETRAEVVGYIDSGHQYFYTHSVNSTAYVETVHPAGRPAYIRTKANTTTKDNLLSLPRF